MLQTGQPGDKRQLLLEETDIISEVIFSDESSFSSTQSSNEVAQGLEDTLRKEMKSAPNNSIAQKLVLSIFQALTNPHDMELRICLIWRKFCQVLRAHLREAKIIPTVTSKQPQLQFSLLQQKIEMIQYCIRCKISREERICKASKGDTNLPDQAEIDDSDEEFFDAEEPSSEELAEGRDKQLDLKMLKYPERNIFIPVVQQHPPLTEDALFQQQELMISLGDSAAGAQSRLKMQTATLESDMSAFKAANPGCIFEDFVRWHSPADWSKEKGLSQRMTLPGNHWVEVWSTSQPDPVTRQKRLFDDTKEAEDILAHLEGANLAQICRLIAPIFVHECLLTALRNLRAETEDATVGLLPVDTAIRLSRDSTWTIASMADFGDQISLVETFEGRAEWLQRNFPESGESKEIVKDFNTKVLSSPETIIQGASRGPIAKIVLEKINDERRNPETGQVYPAPSFPYSLSGLSVLNREYILRTKVARPVRSSSILPQRLYALIGQSEFRMAGAFSEDQTFFL